ncbi:MAG: hypothetical protein ABJD07_06610 [Gemmatimonadaceae bacterium]
MLVPTIASAQGPWAVTLTQTMNPLPIGFCAAIHLTIFDAVGGDVPRNPLGYRVTMADFDIAVATPDGTAAVAQRIDASHWTACACQGAAPGTIATVSATYPAKSLAAASRVPGVSIQRATTFALSAPKGTSNPTQCSAPPVVASANGAGTPASPSSATPVAGAPTTTTPMTTPATTSNGGAPVAAPPVALAPGSAPATPRSGAPTSAPPFATPSGTAGRSAPASALPAVAPIVAINPSGFIAVQTAPGQVQLSWQPVSGASYYVVFGPGSAAGGVQVVGKTTYAVTGAGAGAQEFLVASYYEPGPVSTAASAFTKATLNVTAGSTAAASPPQTTRYRVVATGFRVVKETVDDQLDRDGLRNEAYAAFSMFHFRNAADYELLDKDLRRTQVHGDVLKHADRVRAGSASPTGGLRDGDAFPSDPTIRVGPVGDLSFPFSVWEGSLTDGSDFEVIFPTMWEWSGSPASYDYWFANLVTNAPSTWSSAKAGMTADTTTDAIVTFGTTNAPTSQSYIDRLVRNMALSLSTLSFGALDFTSRDRPIGLQPTGLPSAGLLLTRRGIEGSLNAAGAGASRVSLSIPFVDDPTQPKLRGSYILYLQVERMP